MTRTRTEDARAGDCHLRWSVAGADGGKFNFTPNETGGMPAYLQGASPTTRSPGDANMDNVYEVTVKAPTPTKQHRARRT